MLKSRLIVVLLVWFCAAFPVAAETRIQFQAQGAPDDLRDALSQASLTIGAGEKAPPQDLLAAAQSDYAQLLGVLYSRGYYGGVILIRVDGREAAAIPPLNPPSRIGRIQILVRPGPLYRFETARIGPLAPGTELPPEFRRGLPAGTGAIQDAADAGVEGWRAAGHAKARVAGQNITARHDTQRVAATIGLDPGPRLLGHLQLGHLARDRGVDRPSSL